MSTFDIRQLRAEAITSLRIADSDTNVYIAEMVSPVAEGVKVHDGSCAGHFVVVRSKEHADNLRKALDKAEELGWLK